MLEIIVIYMANKLWWGLQPCTVYMGGQRSVDPDLSICPLWAVCTRSVFEPKHVPGGFRTISSNAPRNAARLMQSDSSALTLLTVASSFTESHISSLCSSYVCGPVGATVSICGLLLCPGCRLGCLIDSLLISSLDFQEILFRSCVYM